MKNETLSRRSLVLRCAATVAALPFGVAALRGVAIADAMKLVGKDDPMAKALQYVDDANSPAVKALRDKKTKDMKSAPQFCDNCAQYEPKGKLDGADVGKCKMIVSGGMVKAKGWCNAWVPKK